MHWQMVCSVKQGCLHWEAMSNCIPNLQLRSFTCKQLLVLIQDLDTIKKFHPKLMMMHLVNVCRMQPVWLQYWCLFTLCAPNAACDKLGEQKAQTNSITTLSFLMQPLWANVWNATFVYQTWLWKQNIHWTHFWSKSSRWHSTNQNENKEHQIK